MTPKEAVDIYRKNVAKNNGIDYICHTQDFFFLYGKRQVPHSFPRLLRKQEHWGAY